MAYVDKALTVIQPEEKKKVTAVCEITFTDSEDRTKSLGQGCLVHRKQPNEYCIVTTDKIIQSQIDKLDAFEVHFTKKYPKKKTFRLEDIKEKVRYVSGLVFIVINMKSSKLKCWNKIRSIYTKSPMAINALDKSKQQFCYIGGDCYEGHLQVSSKTTIEFPGVPSAIPEGLVILQSTSNPTDNSVDVVGIQSQLHDKQMTTIWITEVLETSKTPGNANQQSLAGAGAAKPPNNELQNPFTDDTVAESGGNADSQSSDRASLSSDAGDGTSVEHAQGPIPAGPPNDHHENSLTGPPIQEQQHSTTTDGATGQQIQTVTENYEDYLVSNKIKGNAELLDVLAASLDRTSHRVIKKWDHLASSKEIDAPVEVRLQCQLNGQNSCTQMLFDLLASDVKYEGKKVQDLISALEKIPKNDVRNLVLQSRTFQEDKKISEFIAEADPDLIDSMATHLDQMYKVRRKPFWLLLGNYLKIEKDKLEEIQYCQVNPTKAVMGYYYSKNPHCTIGDFQDVVQTKLERNDVLKILTPIAEKGRDAKMEKVLGLESEEMRAICVRLNKPTTNDWKYLASELGIKRDIYKDFSPDNPNSPTIILFDWIFSAKETLKIGQLCSALEGIDRNDVVKKLREHFQPHSTTN